MNHQHKNLASEKKTVPISPLRPFQIVTLLEMLEVRADSLIHVIHELELRVCSLQFATATKERSEHSPITDEELLLLNITLDLLKEQAIQLGLTLTAQRTWELRLGLLPSDHGLSLHDVLRDLKKIQRLIRSDLTKRTFMFLPQDDLKYYKQKKFFGHKVYSNFPGTRRDVAEAANCYALGRYTACIFHCMRVLEKGLRALVNHLNSKHNAQIVFKPTIEYQNWQGIITAIRNALKSDRKPLLNPQPTKQERRFYSNAAREFQFFKDAWRNDVAHGNEKYQYDAPEAARLLTHVKTFMSQLAKYGLTE